MARYRAAQVPRNGRPSAPESAPKCSGTGAQVRPESVPKSGRNRCPSQSGKRTESDALVDTGLPAMSSYIFANEQARMLLACLRRLTLNAQTVLELRYWSELPELEIQRVLNLPTRAAVAGRLRVAKEALRREWARVQPDLALTEDNLDAWMSDIRQLVDRQNPQDL
jgi:hypothetical protein